MTDRDACEIDFNVHDRRRSVLALVKRLGQAVDATRANPVILDLRKCKYLGPDGAAILAAVCLDLRHGRRGAHLAPPKGPPELRAFFHHSGLDTFALETDVSKAPTLEDKPVLPMKQILTARFQDADPVIEMLHRYGSTHPDTDESLRTCINEITQNIQDHAQSSVGGVMMARFIKSEVRVAIVDRGVGILATLSDRWKDMTAGNVLPRVLLEGRYSALSRANNQGLGLNLLVSIIEGRNGELFVLSGSSAGEIQRNGRNWFGPLPNEFRGTGVFFTLPVI